jgi:hypothetical protein
MTNSAFSIESTQNAYIERAAKVVLPAMRKIQYAQLLNLARGLGLSDGEFSPQADFSISVKWGAKGARAWVTIHGSRAGDFIDSPFRAAIALGLKEGEHSMVTAETNESLQYVASGAHISNETDPVALADAMRVACLDVERRAEIAMARVEAAGSAANAARRALLDSVG